MNMKTTMIALAALAMSGTTHAITSEEIANALGVDPNIATFSLGGVSEWTIDTETCHSGGSALKSGFINNSSSTWQSSDLVMSIDIKEPCRFTLWQKVSMYNSTSYEKLVYSVDNTTWTYTGNADWRRLSPDILLPGRHTIRWSYQRAGNRTTSGANYCVWIDDFTLEPIMPTASKVEVTNIKCQQRYPWNGMVDIDYTVTSDDPNADVWVYPIGYDKDSNTSMAPRALAGDGVNAPVKAGTHRMTWTVTEDYPDFHSTAFTVKMIALVGAAPYMVVDLSGGVDALSYPVSYLSSVPEGGWSDEYKTTKLVLRLIPPGSFMMGSPSDENGRVNSSGYNGGYETLHWVVITKPFYIGVFEVTQKQYELVMGTNPSSYRGDMRPVEQVSYNNIRGSINGAGWPTHNQVDANSFMGRLRSKVNMLFDLPTEAQWEYSCRAGTSSALNNGKDLTDSNMAEVGRYSGNRNDGKGGYSQHTVVGSYLPNAWGLYDLHGNVCEWCVDRFVEDLGSGAVVDPKGAASGDLRLTRGGCWHSEGGAAFQCRSARRLAQYYYSKYAYTGNAYDTWGFRLLCSPVAE